MYANLIYAYQSLRTVWLNDIKTKNLESCITGKYKLFLTFPEKLRGLPLFIMKLWV